MIAATIVGIQSAQSTVVQVAPRNQNSRYWLWAWHLGAIAVACTAIVVEGEFLSAGVATVSGALLGIPLGMQSLAVLDDKGGTAYQRFQASRSFAILAGALACTWLAQAELTELSTIALAVVISIYSAASSLLPRRARSVHAPNYSPGKPGWVVVGLCAALFYRNDTTWLRASLASTEDFLVWNAGLVAYTAVQGIVGFIVIQKLLSKRRDAKQWFFGVATRYRGRIVILFLALCIASIALAAALPAAAAIVIAAGLAVAVGLLSGAVHAMGLNWAPYLAGTLGVVSLLALLTLGTSPQMALVVENVLIAGVLVAAFVTARPRCN